MLVCCLIIIWFVICGSQQSRPGRWLYRAHRWLSVSLFLFFLSITLCACMHVCVYLRKCLHSCVSLHVFVSKCECLCVVLGISTLWTIWYNTACWAKINPACKGSRDTSAHTFTQLAYSLYHVLVLYIVISLHLHVCCCITAIPNRPVLWSSVSLFPPPFLRLICFLPACLYLSTSLDFHLSPKQLAHNLLSHQPFPEL